MWMTVYAVISGIVGVALLVAPALARALLVPDWEKHTTPVRGTSLRTFRLMGVGLLLIALIVGSTSLSGAQ